MDEDPVRFGLIGCGAVGPALAEGVESAAGAELVACADLDADRARDLAGEYGVDRWYPGHEELLEGADPDAAIVATPSGTHASIAVDCARERVHVLCQKPLDVAVDRLDAMLRTCEEHGVTLGGLFNTRFAAGPQRAKRLLETGALGDVVLANGVLPAFRGQEYYDSAAWRGTPDMDGGCLFNQGIHTVDRLAWLNGGIERVFADTDTVAHEIEVEDVAAVEVRYGNGARGTITATTAVRNYPAYDRIEVYGEAGYLVTTPDELVEFAAEGRDEPPGEDELRTGGFAAQIEDMAAAIRADRDPIVPGREARHAPDAVLAMYESAERDAPVSVEGFLDRARSDGE